MKCIYALLLACGMLNAGNIDQIRETIIIHSDNGSFTVRDEYGDHQVENYFVDKGLRNRNCKQMLAYLKAGGYVIATKTSEGDYVIHENGRIPGGGFFGVTAGAWLAKATVSVVGHGSIALVGLGVSLVATPAVGWAVATGLESTVGPMIESVSMAAAVGGGILGGVASGPL